MSRIIAPFTHGIAVLALASLAAGGAFSTYVIRATERAIPAETAPVEVDERDQCQVDKREQQDVLREGKDFTRELNSVIKRAKAAKMTEQVAKLNEIAREVNTKTQMIKNPPVGDDDFCWRSLVDEIRQGGSESWDTLNQVRSCVEVPQRSKELSQISKEWSRVARSKGKTLEKSGINLTAIEALYADFKAKGEEAKQQIAAGDCVEASSTYDEIFNGDANPWQIRGAVERYAEMISQTKRLCNDEIKAAFEEFLAAIKADIDQGNYREADETFNQIGESVWPLLARAQDCRNFRGKGTSPLQQKFEKLFEKFNMPMEGPPEGTEEEPG